MRYATWRAAIAARRSTFQRTHDGRVRIICIPIAPLAQASNRTPPEFRGSSQEIGGGFAPSDISIDTSEIGSVRENGSSAPGIERSKFFLDCGRNRTSTVPGAIA
jgi:hypothetical protein